MTAAPMRPPPDGISIWTLTNWRPDALPDCGSPTCSREIQNGERYIVIPGTNKMLCSSCMLDMHEWQAAVEVTLAYERAQAESERKAYLRRRAAAPRERKAREHTDPSFARRYTAPVRPKLPPIVCARVGCDEQFIPKSYGKKGRQRFCSITCGALGGRHQRRSTGATAERTCPGCGRTFRPTRFSSRNPQVYCSKSCARFAEHGKTNPTPPLMGWDRRGHGCLDCGSRDRHHRGRGLCSRCYQRRVRSKNWGGLSQQ